MAVHTASAGVGSLEKWQSSSEGSACLLFLWPEFLPDLYLLLCESGWTRQRNHNYVSPLGAEQSQALFSHKLRDLRVKSWTKKKVLQGRGKMTQYRRKKSVDAFVFPEWWPHCAPHIFHVSVYAGQSMMLGWGWRAHDQHWLSRPTSVSTPWEPKSMLTLPAYEAL